MIDDPSDFHVESYGPDEKSGDAPNVDQTRPRADRRGRLHWHGDTDATSVRFLVADVIPETGSGLLVGQWGGYKTFLAFDLSAAIITRTHFIQLPILRPGGVLFLAAEGQSQVAVRLQAALEARGYKSGQRAPFAWNDTPPSLLSPKGLDNLVQLAAEAQERLKSEFDLPLVLIIIDTLVASAGYTKDGQDNDAATTQIVLGKLAQLSNVTGAFVLGVDHYGKNPEVGTRGSSAKEAAADVVLALLCDRDNAGKVANPRLALRKRRTGENGLEFPFTPRVVDMGCDGNGRTVTTLVLDRARQDGVAQKPADDIWATKSLNLLRRVMMNMLADSGKDVHPWTDGPVVRAIDIEIVRAEFYKSHVADGKTAEKKQAAHRQAFHRAVRTAQEKNLIGVREIEGSKMIWLAVPDAPVV